MEGGILVNLFSFTPRSATGVFVYVDNLLRELVRLDNECTYWIVVREDMYRYLRNILGYRENVKFIVFGKFAFFLPRVAARLLRKRSIVEAVMCKQFQEAINQYGIRLVFFPSGSLIPQGLHGVKTVVTLYDLQYEYFPENFPPQYLKTRREGNRNAALRSDHVLAISEFTKKTLIEKYGTDEGKITVTHLAPQTFPEPEPTPLPGQFIFYPAGLWPHKNHLVLLRALIMLKDKFPALHLVLTGIDKWHEILKGLRREAERSGVADRINYLGHVRNGVLHYIYKNVAALVFPSGFEGFGVPLVEAFALGVPVIAADNTSIPEVIGGAGLLVPTGDVQALAGAIERVLTDQKLRSELIAKGYERAKLFSWEKTARETLSVFDNLI